MRTTVDIDAHLLKRLRDAAHEQGISFKELLNRVLRKGIAEPPAGRREPYRCPTFSLGRALYPLDKALALAASLEEEEVARRLTLRK